MTDFLRSGAWIKTFRFFQRMHLIVCVVHFKSYTRASNIVLLVIPGDVGDVVVCEYLIVDPNTNNNAGGIVQMVRAVSLVY